MERWIMIPDFTHEDLMKAMNAAWLLEIDIILQDEGDDLYAIGTPADLGMLFNYCMANE